MKNEVLTAIAERRSIRSYKAEPVTDEQIAVLSRAAVEAPSAVNRQPYHFTFVRDAALLGAFSAEAIRLIQAEDPAAPAMHILRGAPCVCFIFCDPENGWAKLDSGIAVENLALAAHAIGLGSVILGMPKKVFDAGTDHWAERLDCPAGYTFAIAIGIGVPAAGKEAHPVREGLVSTL